MMLASNTHAVMAAPTTTISSAPLTTTQSSTTVITTTTTISTVGIPMAQNTTFSRDYLKIIAGGSANVDYTINNSFDKNTSNVTVWVHHIGFMKKGLTINLSKASGTAPFSGVLTINASPAALLGNDFRLGLFLNQSDAASNTALLAILTFDVIKAGSLNTTTIPVSTTTAPGTTIATVLTTTAAASTTVLATTTIASTNSSFSVGSILPYVVIGIVIIVVVYALVKRRERPPAVPFDLVNN